MRYRYVVLADTEGRLNEEPATSTEAALREMGLEVRLASSQLKLFASKETPTLPVPGGGVVIGHVFSRDGTLLVEGAQFPPLSSHAQIRKRILDNCWGAYLLVQPAAGSMRGISVMRDPSPSCELPCFYSLRNGTGFITSDLPLAADVGLYRKRVDWDYIASRLIYPYVKTARTGLTDIRELLPGGLLHLSGTTVTRENAWSPWDFVAPERRHADLHEAAAEVRSTVETVVQAWAGLEDSILLELSGGLDSSIVGTCLQGTRARVVCCNLLTPLPGADERQYAGLIAANLGVPLEVEELGFENARFDAPPSPHSATPRIGPLQHAIDDVMDAAADRHGVGSYFSGGGGDTVFCYLGNAVPAADAFKERGWTAGMAAVRNLTELYQCTFWKAGRLTLKKLLGTPKAPYKVDRSFLAPGASAEAPESHPWFAAPAHALPGDRERIIDLAGNQLFRDYVPRSMKRQFRMPLLSQPVVEACLKAPTWMWISGGRNRAVARAAFVDALPVEILNRRSKGTFTSYLGAIYERNRDRMREFLLTGHLAARGLLDTDALKRFFESQAPPRDKTFSRIYDLCMVENWLRHQSLSPACPSRSADAVEAAALIDRQCEY